MTLGLVNPTARVEPLHALSERALVDAYGAGAALETGPVRSEACVCGGSVEASPWEIRTQVEAHQRMRTHAAWRQQEGL